MRKIFFLVAIFLVGLFILIFLKSTKQESDLSEEYKKIEKGAAAIRVENSTSKDAMNKPNEVVSVLKKKKLFFSKIKTLPHCKSYFSSRLYQESKSLNNVYNEFKTIPDTDISKIKAAGIKYDQNDHVENEEHLSELKSKLQEIDISPDSKEKFFSFFYHALTNQELLNDMQAVEIGLREKAELECFGYVLKKYSHLFQNLDCVNDSYEKISAIVKKKIEFKESNGGKFSSVAFAIMNGINNCSKGNFDKIPQEANCLWVFSPDSWFKRN